MTFNNSSKTVFQKQIKQKQALFNRFKKRYSVAHNPSERSFLKTEAVRIASELRQCSRQWTNCGFGGCTWITKNYKPSSFTGGTVSRRVSSRNSYRTTNGRTSRGTRSNRRSSSASRSHRSSSARRSYVAW